MLDKNLNFYEGVIGDDYSMKRAKTGKEFITFSLCVNAFFKDMADDTERTTSQQYIRIFVYDKKCIAYLKKVKARRGNRAFVFGRVQSVKNEYRGIEFITLSIMARDVAIIKTKADKEYKADNNTEKKEEQ